MPVTFDITGKIAVITGAGGVICSVLAREMAEKGVRVALLDLFIDAAEKVAEEIRANGGDALAIQADVLNRDSLTVAKAMVLQHFGTVDILVNGAGGNKAGATTSSENTFFDLDLDALRWVFDLNVVGAVLTTQVFGEIFAEKQKGQVLNIASMSSYLPLTNTIAYSSAKAAVANFTQWMAVHFNLNYSPEIRVNAIAPGFILTTQNQFLLTNSDGSPTARGKAVIAKTPMGRYGDPSELAGAIIWLCSPAASFVNGAIIPIDGGFSAYWGV